MLNGTGDTDSNVELGGDDLTGLTDLEGVVGVTSVDSGTRSPDSGVERVSEGLNVLDKVVGRLECTTTGNDTAGGGKVGARRLGDLLLEEVGERLYTFGLDLFSSGAATLLGSGVKGSASDGEDLDLVG